MVEHITKSAELEHVILYAYRFSVDVKKTHTPPLWEVDIALDTIVQKKQIKALRDLYRTLGKQPSRYRSSIEALMRRVAQGKGLYAINNVVDAGNRLSLMLECPIGIYDIDQIKGEVAFSIGKAEAYETIGKGLLNIESLPTLYDEIGPFGNPNSDSKRTMVNEKTREILVVVYVFDDGALKEETLLEALLQFQTDLI